MRTSFLVTLIALIAGIAGIASAAPAAGAANFCSALSAPTPRVTNQCIAFTVGPGTGCAWMCAHCADLLGPAYYFTDGVCTYQSGGCVGNPLAGVTYTCCAQ
jgi:hypothetical protein